MNLTRFRLVWSEGDDEHGWIRRCVEGEGYVLQQPITRLPIQVFLRTPTEDIVVPWHNVHTITITRAERN